MPLFGIVLMATRHFKNHIGQNRTLQWPAPRILRGKGGQQLLKTVLNITASFSDELLQRRCGISDVVFEGGCVILDNFLGATTDAEDPHVPQCALTH